MPLSEFSFEKEKIPEHIKRLKHLLEDFSDEIPKQWLSGNGDYKVRMSWWHSLLDTLDLANMEAITNSALKIEIECFISKYSESGLSNYGTKRENIDEANALIKKVIENLQNSI